MAGSVHIEKNDFQMILASEGVDFLISAEEEVVPLSTLLDDGMKVYLFFSANWCRPCQDFTLHLVQVYNTLKNAGEKLEIVVISFDRDENSFHEHLKSMSWLAVPFNVNLHKKLGDRFMVPHIPMLIPLCSDGNSVEENAVDMIQEYGSDAFPFTQKRRQELKAMDDQKRQGAILEELLACEKRNHLLSRDRNKVSVSEVIGKTIGLYFGAYWCPPSRIFTSQLIEAYYELVTSKNTPFEVIFISTDRDQNEFNYSLSTMPWFSIPYEDKSRHDLRRIFEIKGIPALILIGADGKIISTNGRSLVSSYGASAFPFTESRIAEIKAALRKEGDDLPRSVRDVKHEHELKLDMAKTYVCDSCHCQGKFWAFSCDVCNYDLHPSCVEQSVKDAL
ncbi:hypothetical protein Dimus_010838 [Dionaea muscipula]